MNHTTIKCPCCGYDTYLILFDLPGVCPHCHALVK